LPTSKADTGLVKKGGFHKKGKAQSSSMASAARPKANLPSALPDAAHTIPTRVSGLASESALNHSVLDIHHDLVIPIDRVKMGWSMVTIIHRDNYAKESTDLWQRCFLS
jgi:hypothetical protein